MEGSSISHLAPLSTVVFLLSTKFYYINRMNNFSKTFKSILVGAENPSKWADLAQNLLILDINGSYNSRFLKMINRTKLHAHGYRHFFKTEFSKLWG